MGNSSQVPPPQAYGIQVAQFLGGGDFGRGGPYYGANGPYPPGVFPPLAYFNGIGGPWDGGFPGGMYPGNGGLRQDSGGRRLSERISGFAGENSVIPAAAGLPPKPTPAALDTALVSGNSSLRRNSGRNGSTQLNGPPPPPPPDAKEDPRAAGGKRVSYHDMDLVAEVCSLFYCARSVGAHCISKLRAISN